MDGFVGEDGHEEIRSGGANLCEGFEDAAIDVGEVKFVHAVVVKEEGECFGYILFIVCVAFRVAESATDQHACSVADVARDDGFGEFGLSKMDEASIDRVAEVDARIDEGAVEIEDEKCEGHV